MKKFLCLLFSLSCAVTMFAAPDAAQIFRNTTRHVDLDGNNLLYINTTELGSMINALPGNIGKTVSALNEKPENVDNIVKGAEIILKTLNLNALKAAASSEKQYKKDLFLSKSVLYFGKAAALPGLFNTSHYSNDLSLNATLAEFPADVIAAVKFPCYPEGLFNDLEKNIAATGNAKIKKLYEKAKAEIVKENIDTKAMLTSIGGNWSIVIAGNSEANLRFTLTIPDHNGALTAYLKKVFPVAPKTPDRSLIQTPFKEMKPAILYLDKKVVLTSNTDLYAKVEKAFALPADFIRMLPANAASFKVVRLTPELIAGLKKIDELTKEPVALKLLNALKPGMAFEATLVESDSVRSITVADFSADDLLMGLLNMLNEIKR